MLRAELTAAGLVPPTYGPDSLAAVLPAAAGALGADFTSGTGLTAAGCAAAFDLPRSERVLVLLCDGLGLENLAANQGHAPFLRRRLSEVRPLTSSFPSTTAAALATFGTATGPGLTGLVGYTQRVPATGALANMVSWTEQARPTEVTDQDKQRHAPPLATDPRELQREPTVFEALTAAGVPVTSLGRARFAGSGMTQAALRGGSFVGVETLEERVATTARELRRNPGLAYLYWGELDKTGHGHGPGSQAWLGRLEQFDAALGALLRAVPKGTLVLLTADHGQVAVDPYAQVDVAAEPSLREGVDLIAGEPRAIHIYTREPEAVAARWRYRLGAAAVVASRGEAIRAGLFGPVAPHVEAWLGDLVAITRGATTIVDSRTQTKASLTLKGVHGSLTPTEMTVPLLPLTT